MAFPVILEYSSVPTGFTIDPHVKLLNERIVRRAKARGLDALVYAPHFTRVPAIQERAERFSDDDLLIIPGREVFAGTWRNRKHVLAIGLSDPVPDFITLEGAMEAFDQQGAAVLVPHPDFMTVSLDEADIERFADRIHALETYNPKHLTSHNRRAQVLCNRFDQPAFASSYAHLTGSVGEVWTSMNDVELSESGIVEAFIDGVDRKTGHRTGTTHQLRCLAEFGHLFVENTWQKFDRVVLSGQEPTHPRHPAYEGRFDEVACY